MHLKDFQCFENFGVIQNDSWLRDMQSKNYMCNWCNQILNNVGMYNLKLKLDFEHGWNKLEMDLDWINNMHWEKVATLTTNSWDKESTHDLIFS
jgi:hypothetical protein